MTRKYHATIRAYKQLEAAGVDVANLEELSVDWNVKTIQSRHAHGPFQPGGVDIRVPPVIRYRLYHGEEQETRYIEPPEPITAADGIRTPNREQEHPMANPDNNTISTEKIGTPERRAFLAVQDHPVSNEAIMLDIDELASMPEQDREDYLERLTIRELRIALNGAEQALNEHRNRADQINTLEHHIRSLATSTAEHGQGPVAMTAPLKH